MASKKITIVIVGSILISAYLGLSFGNGILFHSIPGNDNQYVREYSLPHDSAPNGLVVDKNGLVWVATKHAILYSIDQYSGQVKNYAIKNGTVYENAGTNATMVWTMLADGDSIWFSPYGAHYFWKFDQSLGTFEPIRSQTGTPFQMKLDKEGEIWFTTLRGNTVGVMKKTGNDTYQISTFGTGNGTNPAGIFLQNESIWVAEIGSQSISQYAINHEDGHVKSISLVKTIPRDNASLFSSPTDLLIDKNTVWLTEHDTSFLTSYNIDDGKITRYPTSQNGFHTTTLPFWIRGMHDPHILWFNEHQGNKIGCFDLYNKTLTEYFIPSLPNDGYLTYPLNIAQDPRDEKILWFSEWNTDKIGMINGHLPIPFGIHLDTEHVTLMTGKAVTVGMEIQGNVDSHLSLNASSTITPAAELGNLTVQFSSHAADMSHDSKIGILLRDGGVAPGNYTVGISASDGVVTTTKFIGLSVEGK